MKEWFPHDYAASLDNKLRELLAVGGASAYGLFWLLTEALHLSDSCLTVAQQLACIRTANNRNAKRDFEIIMSLDLFEDCGDYITSKRVTAHLAKRKEKSNKAKANADARWGNDANAMQTQCETDADAMLLKNKSNSKKYSKKNTSVSDDANAFETFWESYRRKGSKRLAFAEWQKMTDDERGLALAHAPPYCASREKQFQKDAQRYLKFKTYHDEIVNETHASTSTTPTPNSRQSRHIAADELQRDHEERKQRFGLVSTGSMELDRVVHERLIEAGSTQGDQGDANRGIGDALRTPTGGVLARPSAPS